ncbi:MAG TPA: MBL fold metallo-hydrolase [Gemmatimonadales bacterium]|jgi:L-ascorbate metabolism protein UlaG (beta-lactamase superfamily)|nr:MBL fold metallo-hydrolase [Gemmatimonadales bacterium]
MFRSHLQALRRYRRLSGEYRKMDGAGTIAPAPHRPDPASWPDDGVTLAWLGHATVLLKVFGTWIITDPVLGRRIGVSIGPVQIGVRRLVAPALRVRELPPIDLVLISHAHFDHLDLPTLARIPRTATVVASSSLRDLLRRFRDVRELGWGESTRVGDIDITSTPAKHWGARMITDRYRGWGGFMLETRGTRIFYAGDTAYTDALRPLATRGAVDIAIMPIGAYDPWIANHCSPEEAWTMANELHARAVVPVHHSTFRLSREPMAEPIERLRRAAGGEANRIVTAEIGDTWRMPAPGVR